MAVILPLNAEVIQIRRLSPQALDNSCFNQEAIVVADDTDILALHLYFWNSEIGDIILQSMFKISNVFSHLNMNFLKKLLLYHAWVGCHTFSFVFNHGKTAILNLIEKENHEILDICGIFDMNKKTLVKLKFGHFGDVWCSLSTFLPLSAYLTYSF